MEATTRHLAEHLPRDLAALTAGYLDKGPLIAALGVLCRNGTIHIGGRSTCRWEMKQYSRHPMLEVILTHTGMISQWTAFPHETTRPAALADWICNDGRDNTIAHYIASFTERNGCAVKEIEAIVQGLREAIYWAAMGRQM